MKRKRLNRCPVCGGEMEITEYTCPSCGTIIRGTFKPGVFDVLSEEQIKFLKAFILSYGNISEVAKKFNISHPTCKLRLKEIIDALGWEDEKDISPSEVVEMLERGEITVEEALRFLKKEG